MMFRPREEPRLVLGTDASAGRIERALRMESRLVLTPAQVNTHKYIIGKSGMGKSKLLESMWLQLHQQGVGVSIIDPHGGTAEAILGYLIQSGFYNHPGAFDRVKFVEFGIPNWHIPFNVLKQPHLAPHDIADDVLDAMHRIWPALGNGVAPAFDNIIKRGSRVLIANDLTLPALEGLVTDDDYRRQLLAQVHDYGVLGFWKNFFNEMSSRDQMEEIKSTIRRISLLTDNPSLEYALGQQENALNFRELIDSGTCVIYSLRRLSGDARRLVGAFLMLGYEKAALSRNPYDPGAVHQLLVDEFSQFSQQSSDALNTMLSETRKFGLFVTMAHQTRVQLGDATLGGLQNVQVNAAFQLGDEDARELAKLFGKVDSTAIKHEVADPSALERTHPTFYSLQEGWEKWVDALKDLPARTLLVKVGADPAYRVRTPVMPRPTVSYAEIEALKDAYRDLLMKEQSTITLPHQQHMHQPKTASRTAPIRP